MIAISSIKLVTSKKDIAGMNIRSFIAQQAMQEVVLFDNDSIYSDKELEECTTPGDSVIYLSRHSAKSMRPSLTVHAVGNYGEALYGGKPSTLGFCDSYILKQLLLNIVERINTEDYDLGYEYELSIEATHHGPETGVPVAFIEVGSCELQWEDLEACRLIADAVNLLLEEGIKDRGKWVSAIALGGNHYSSKFSKLIHESEVALGHVCAKYAVPFLSADLIDQMMDKTTPHPSRAYFDRKSLKRKQEIRKWLEKYDIEIIQL